MKNLQYLYGSLKTFIFGNSISRSADYKDPDHSVSYYLLSNPDTNTLKATIKIGSKAMLNLQRTAKKYLNRYPILEQKNHRQSQF